MKIIIAPDSFKGSISASNAAQAIERGIKRYMPHAQTILVPVADGGEGTLDCLIAAAGGVKLSATVTGPLGAPVTAAYGLLEPDQTAVIEMATASGLYLIPSEERNPLLATTYGTGELIRHALNAGCRSFLLALGGSATNDGGAGMLQALGMRLLDSEGNSVGYGGGTLDRIASIDDSNWDPRIAESRFLIASDVQNPFIGPDGASRVFGPQKGASPEMVEQLELNLTAWADIIAIKTGKRVHQLPGAGAAGGISGAFLAFFPASIKRGIDIVIEYSHLRDHLQAADLVITGEGQIDFQTASGKTPMGIAQEAHKLGVPTICLAGSVGRGIEALYEVGITSVHSIVTGPMTLQEAMSRASELLELTAEQVVRTFHASAQKD
ncbi:glycerate kinase [Paenibacillus sp. FSL H7-0331]|uniref:glycerate kinase family protein n=1 Tax=Paenibacillus sp. FSL H7-0331 TaxID=1920421 RepID=UPI00096D5CC0|nr:glycerate kinase [Paenibacillus sp. FSL H7-0331]OMF07101.1 glycerate kinase [Paenibacillus sp. FSL H7-0331]